MAANDPERSSEKDVERALDDAAKQFPTQPLEYASSGSASLSDELDPEKASDHASDDKQSRPNVHRTLTTSTGLSALSTDAPLSTLEKSRKPWYKRLNPLKWGKDPQVPTERTVSPEYYAGFWSVLTFYWMGPLMTTGYRRPLEMNDIYLVNPDRGTDVLAERMKESFEMRRARGDKYPLIFACYDMVRWEFILGGLCSLMSSIFQVLSPFTLRYLISFAEEAYAGQGPGLGTGLGLVFGVLVMQILQSIGTSHFIYRGFMVGAQIRAVLITIIFEKALKVSGRARAGGKSPEQEAEDERRKEDLKRVKQNLIEKLLATNAKASGQRGSGPAADRVGYPNGRIVNMMSTDTYRIYEASGMFHLIWTAPFSAIITLVVLLINLTYSALAGFALLVIGMPLLTKAIKKLLLRRRAISKITDQRVSLTSEVLQSVRFVKFFGWESSFLHRINEIRKREVSAIQIVLSMRNAILAVSMSLPIFASMLSFITYDLTNHALNPAEVFSSLALFNSLRMPLNLLPMVIGQITDAWAAMGRIQDFLLAEEQQDQITWDMESERAIVISNATFTWEESSATQAPETGKGEKRPDGKDQQGPKRDSRRWSKRLSMWNKRSSDSTMVAEATAKTTMRGASEKPQQTEPFRLRGIELSVARDELIAVIGTVGSGKSSLLAALAGDMRMTEGSVTMGASRAFCPQYAWIQNTTVKENILFGQKWDRERYNQVVDACALRADLEMLPAGDLTEIGERGITLSGGQKQRLNIARAIYHNSDLVLMDDPLSAVDAHVGRHIFDKAICGVLKGKCRVLATHQLHVLSRCDRIVVLDDGVIRTIDTFENLMANDGLFQTMMSQTAQEEKEEEKEKVEEDGDEREAEKTDIRRKKKAKKAAALMTQEERTVNSVSWSVYGAYLRASGTLFNGPFVILFLILSQCANIATSLWLSYWTSGTFGLSTGLYIGVYAALGVLQSVLMFTFSVSVAIGGTKASRIMLRDAMRRVLRAPMSFFDTTPLGRIINRFSKDVDIMDNSLTDAIRMFTLTIAMIVAVFALIIVYFHYFAIALGPLLVVFVFSANYYRASAREVKRIEAIKRSFVFARFSEGISGVASIRAYGLANHFIQDMRNVTDDMNSAYYLTFSNQRWLSLRLDAIGNLLVFVTGLLVVTSRFDVSPSISGLVLSYILSIVQMMQFSVRQLSEVENAMNSTERIYYYGTALEEEAPLHMAPVPEKWPERGQIDFNDAQMRYRENLPLVLQGFDMHVAGGERIGIVGRTGAGKSSIMSTLFRLTELSNGSITIDGIDIAKIGLEDLRSRLAIIPQDPTLFKGTIRSNLDPFNQHNDTELWSALRQADLVGQEAKMEDGAATSRIHLDGLVEEEGLNYSLGQRQLMALARALVRNCQIIVCDEATSSVDMETDQKIQRTIATAFKGRTLLCIAHRLKTIIGYDRICVMDAGRIAELDEPLKLWEEGGIFRGMCERSGIRREDFDEMKY
ncbi:MAG: hypothetical protein LQ340_004282 [Diploschistes diacapsis]|nr:MAG: hypothetical protein LQ340_004282 [Diploschistes diacapsis]